MRDGTDDDLLVVGVLMDVIKYGTNIEVRSIKVGRFTKITPQLARVFFLPPVTLYGFVAGTLNLKQQEREHLQ